MLVLWMLSACEQSITVSDRLTEDRFHQLPVVEAADVLFVIDDSKSMVEEQDLLAESIGAFLSVLTDTDADYQFAVVTTDVDGPLAGQARGGVLDPYLEGVDELAGAAMAVGTDGSRYEQGLGAAILAIDGEHIPGFPRENAHLELVFVSDEDDQTDGDVEDLMDEIVQRAPSEGWTAHGVVGDLPSGCASPAGAAAAAPRYQQVITGTGGLFDSICAESYAELLQKVGFEAAGLQDTFPLSALPAPESLAVWVDEVLIHPREVDGWTYDPGQNAIVFHGTTVPRADMDVLVEYQATGKLGDD